jgi:hypothetical protein
MFHKRSVKQWLTKPLIVFAAVAVIFGGITVLGPWPYFSEQPQTFDAFAVNWRPPPLPSLLVVGILVIWVLWKFPKWQVAHSKALTDEKTFDRENEARKTLAQILAGGGCAGWCVFIGADVQPIQRRADHRPIHQGD